MYVGLVFFFFEIVGLVFVVVMVDVIQVVCLFF
jgi:hypothetical protein